LHNVFKGVMVGFVGFVVWVTFSIFEGINRALGKPGTFSQAGMFLGFALMVGGPVAYIVVLPIVDRLRKRR
jgi:hypothetical protein